MADAVALNAKAVCKLMLHAVKYPHLPVNGLLLTSKQSSSLHVVDSIPLFHLNLTLTPMLEIALVQIEAYCNRQGLQIAGYYQANENLSHASPTPCAFKICDKIRENGAENAILLMIKNEGLHSSYIEDSLELWKYTDGKPKPQAKCAIDERASEYWTALVAQNEHRRFVDFDNHLEDVSSDWRNSHLDALLN